MRAIFIGLLVVITSSVWADGFRPGTDPWGYKQTQSGAWYRPGTDPYPGNAPAWGAPDYRSTSSGWYRPGVDPYPGNARYGRRGGGSSGEVAAFIVGGLLGYYLGDRHNDTPPAPQSVGRYCPQCGQKASMSTANFCSKCGVKLQMEKPVSAGTFSPAPD